MKKPFYVVTMYKNGDRRNHSYLLGVFSTKTKAEKAGEEERLNRGGTKYIPECLEVPVNGNLPFKSILLLKEATP